MKDNKKFNRALLSMLAFITVCLFLILYMSFTVFADGNININQKYDVTSIFDQNDFQQYNDPSFVLNSVDTRYNTYTTLLNNGINVADMNIMYDIRDSSNATTINDYDGFFWSTNFMIFCSNNSFVAVNNSYNGYVLYVDTGYDSLPSNIRYYFYDSYGSNADYVSIAGYNTVEIDGKIFLKFSNLAYILNCNIPIYYEDNLNNPTRENQINPNYSGGVPVENSDNNLFLDSGYLAWVLRNPIKQDGNNYRFNGDNILSGYATFNYELNDYQKEHLDEFKFNITSRINYSIKFHGSDGYKTFTATNYDLDLPFNIARGQPFTINFLDIFNTTNFTGYFNENLSQPIEMDKSNFTISITIKVVSVSSNNTSGFYSDTYNVLNNKVSNKSKEITTNQNPYSSNGSGVGGDSEYPLDLYQPDDITVQTGDGVTYNGNGSPTAVGGNANASGGVAYGSNVNNSVIVNTNNDPKAVVDYIKGELIPTGDAVGFVDKLSDATEGNEFLGLMNDTFSYVPQTVWNDLSFYFEVFLGVLVAGFILRIILDLL